MRVKGFTKWNSGGDLNVLHKKIPGGYILLSDTDEGGMPKKCADIGIYSDKDDANPLAMEYRITVERIDEVIDFMFRLIFEKITSRQNKKCNCRQYENLGECEHV